MFDRKTPPEPVKTPVVVPPTPSGPQQAIADDDGMARAAQKKLALAREAIEDGDTSEDTTAAVEEHVTPTRGGMTPTYYPRRNAKTASKV